MPGSKIPPKTSEESYFLLLASMSGSKIPPKTSEESCFYFLLPDSMPGSKIPPKTSEESCFYFLLPDSMPGSKIPPKTSEESCFYFLLPDSMPGSKIPPKTSEESCFYFLLPDSMPGSKIPPKTSEESCFYFLLPDSMPGSKIPPKTSEESCFYFLLPDSMPGSKIPPKTSEESYFLLLASMSGSKIPPKTSEESCFYFLLPDSMPGSKIPPKTSEESCFYFLLPDSMPGSKIPPKTSEESCFYFLLPDSMPGSKIPPKTSEESYFVLLTSRMVRVLVHTRSIPSKSKLRHLRHTLPCKSVWLENLQNSCSLFLLAMSAASFSICGAVQISQGSAVIHLNPVPNPKFGYTIPKVWVHYTQSVGTILFWLSRQGQIQADEKNLAPAARCNANPPGASQEGHPWIVLGNGQETKKGCQDPHNSRCLVSRVKLEQRHILPIYIYMSFIPLKNTLYKMPDPLLYKMPFQDSFYKPSPWARLAFYIWPHLRCGGPLQMS